MVIDGVRFLGSTLWTDFALFGEGDRVALWSHGHMHDAFDYQINDVRVVCNPRGYAPRDLSPDFQPGLVVEI